VFALRQEKLQRVFPKAAITTADDAEVIRRLLTSSGTRTTAGEPAQASVPQMPLSSEATRPARPARRSAVPEPVPDRDVSSGTIADELRDQIEALQRRHVRESISPYDCFTDRDLASFIAAGTPARAADSLRQSPRFQPIVEEIRRMTRLDRNTLLSAARKPLHKSWTELGRVGPEGQTDAGVRAELLIASAVVDLLAASR
jgi:hypothetical protein